MSQCHESCLVGWPGRVWGGLGEIFMFKAELRIYSSGHTLLKTLLNGANSLTPLTSLVCSVSMWGGEKWGECGGGLGYLGDPSPTPADPARLQDQNAGDPGGVTSYVTRKNGHPRC